MRVRAPPPENRKIGRAVCSSDLGEGEEVALAIDEHYMLRFAGDELPQQVCIVIHSNGPSGPKKIGYHC